MNKFIKPIVLKKKPHDFKSWLEYRKVLKHCKNLSPSFDDLWEISDFINILRFSYMYCNNESFHLFLASLPKNHTKLDSASFAYKDKEFSIYIVLFKESKEINIEIKRSGQNIKDDSERIKFKDGSYKCKSIYDEEKFLFIIASIMNGVTELIEYYYKNKKF